MELVKLLVLVFKPATRGTNIIGSKIAIIGTAGALTGVAITNVDVIYKPRDISTGYNQQLELHSYHSIGSRINQGED